MALDIHRYADHVRGRHFLAVQLIVAAPFVVQDAVRSDGDRVVERGVVYCVLSVAVVVLQTLLYTDPALWDRQPAGRYGTHTQ